MTRLPTLTLAALGLAMALPAAAQNGGGPDVESRAEAPALTKGDRELAKLLEGRTAGEPVRCIRAFPSQRMRTIEGTAYVYGQGDTIYVQRTRDPQRIDRTDALVSNRFGGSQLCKLDIMTTIDPITGIFTGAVFFEDFVPYTRSSEATAREG